MSTASKSIVSRATEWSLRRLVRLWPPETREWAAALAAEATEIESPGASLCWLLGGLMFLLRSIASHFLAWMRLPAGANSPLGPGGGDPPPRLPRHSRLVTASFLLAAFALLLFPQGREAVTAVRASWSSSEMSASDKGAIEDLAAQAVRERSARKLAFAAISYPEQEKSNTWAEQAVAMDPSLRWIYASHAAWGMRWEIPESHLQALREFDPDNSFVYLLSADRIYRKKILPVYDFGTPTRAQINQALASDPQWEAWMEKALEMPRYDNYEQKRYELQSRIWSEKRYLSPDVIAQSIESHAWPDTGNLIALGDLRIEYAKEARQAGNDVAAEFTLRAMLTFVDRVAASGQRDSTIAALQNVELKCLTELEVLYKSEGRDQDTPTAAEKLAQLKKAQIARASFLETHYSWIASFRWKAFAVQISALALLFLGPISALSLVVLEIAVSFPRANLGLLRGWTCFVVDYAPFVLLATSVTLLLFYRPFVHAFDTFRSGDLALTSQGGFVFLLYSLRFASPMNFEVGVSPFFWLLMTIALSCLALFILLRPFWKRRAAA